MRVGDILQSLKSLVFMNIYTTYSHHITLFCVCIDNRIYESIFYMLLSKQLGTIFESNNWAVLKKLLSKLNRFVNRNIFSLKYTFLYTLNSSNPMSIILCSDWIKDVKGYWTLFSNIENANSEKCRASKRDFPRNDLLNSVV